MKFREWSGYRQTSCFGVTELRAEKGWHQDEHFSTPTLFWILSFLHVSDVQNIRVVNVHMGRLFGLAIFDREAKVDIRRNFPGFRGRRLAISFERRAEVMSLSSSLFDEHE
jgi:hypothetical protein